MSSARSVYSMHGTRAVPNPYVDTTSLFTSALFRGLRPDDAATLANAFRFLDVAGGRVLYSRGDAGDYLYVVLSGKVKLVECHRGREHLIAVVGPGDQFGQLEIFDSEPHSVTAVAATDGQLARIPSEDLLAHAVQCPQVALHLLRAAARQLRSRDMFMSDLVLIDASARVAKLLLSLAHRFGVDERGELRVDHGLTQKELAQLVGATRETVNKILSNFATRGWIGIDSRGLVIRDRGSLARRAGRNTALALRTSAPADGRPGYSTRGSERGEWPRQSTLVRNHRA